jgi:hypothetical protein
MGGCVRAKVRATMGVAMCNNADKARKNRGRFRCVRGLGRQNAALRGAANSKRPSALAGTVTYYHWRCTITWHVLRA